jgi:hypothetical protein
MLKKETADKIKSFGFDVDKLIAAIKDDAEVDYVVPEVQVFTAADLEARDTNTKAEGKKEGVIEGKTAGMEIAGKAIAKKFNLPDTVDKKNLDKVIEATAATITTGDEGLKEQIKLLQKDKETQAAQIESISKEKDAIAFDTSLISMFPANRTADLPDDERLLLIKKNLQFETVDGKQVVKKNGEIIRNTTTKDPLIIKDAIETMFTERKWVADAGAGRGGGDNTGGSGASGIKTYSAATQQWLKDNPQGNIISPQCTAFIGKIAKESTDFDWNA